MITPSIYCLYLASEGDSIEIKGLGNQFIPVELLNATTYKTHEQVLDFLKNVRKTELKDTFIFYHLHNSSYEAHCRYGWPRGVAHECPLDKQISFVKYKIFEKEHGVRQNPKL